MSSPLFFLLFLLPSLLLAQTPPGITPSTNLPLIVQFPNIPPFKPGTKLTIQDTQSQPTISLPYPPSSPSSQYYFLLAFDPDAPSQQTPYLASVLHWAQPSLHLSSPSPSNTTTTSPPSSSSSSSLLLLTSSSPPVSSWIGPSPTLFSGPHRYTFLLLTQASPTFSLPSYYSGLGSGVGRGRNITRFDVEGFVRRTGLGGVVGGCWFVVENGTDGGGGGGSGPSASGAGGTTGGMAVATTVPFVSEGGRRGGEGGGGEGGWRWLGRWGFVGAGVGVSALQQWWWWWW